MNNLAYRNILEGNWEEIKGKLQEKWGKLTDDDIDKINGSYKKLIGKLQKIYGYKLEELEDELTEFFDSSDFESMKQYAVNKINQIKEIALSTWDECARAEKKAVKYAKENPFKVLGIVALTGLAVSYIYKAKR